MFCHMTHPFALSTEVNDVLSYDTKISDSNLETRSQISKSFRGSIFFHHLSQKNLYRPGLELRPARF
jgi:hypothetical protein